MVPSFFIIGAPKCGTTSMYKWLSSHPDIFMCPSKEPRFFDRDIDTGYIKSLDDYERLFASANPNHEAVGEATSSYLYSRVAIQNIENIISCPKYIIMLRNPAQMALSLYDQHCSDGKELAESFQEAWFLSNKRKQGNPLKVAHGDPKMLAYKSVCRLSDQLLRLEECVPEERRIYISLDELSNKPKSVYERTINFLNVRRYTLDKFYVHNKKTSSIIPSMQYVIKKGTSIFKSFKKHFFGIPPTRGSGISNVLLKMNTKKGYTKNYEIPDDALRFSKVESRKILDLTGVNVIKH